MEYNFDLQQFRESRGISRMKFCELSGILPGDLKDLEDSFRGGWTRGDPEVVEKAKDAVSFIEEHDIRIFRGGREFQVTWKSEGKERAHLFPMSTCLRRRNFE